MLVNMGLECLYFSPVGLYWLNKIFILSKELTNTTNPREYDLGLEGHHHLNGRPPLLVPHSPQVQQVGSTIQMHQITDPSEPQLVVVEQQVEVLGLPGVVAHVEGDLHKAVVEVTDLLLSGEVLSLLPQDAPPGFLPLGEDVFEVAVDGVGPGEFIGAGEGGLS